MRNFQFYSVFDFFICSHSRSDVRRFRCKHSRLVCFIGLFHCSLQFIQGHCRIGKEFVQDFRERQIARRLEFEDNKLFTAKHRLTATDRKRITSVRLDHEVPVLEPSKERLVVTANDAFRSTNRSRSRSRAEVHLVTTVLLDAKAHIPFADI